MTTGINRSYPPPSNKGGSSHVLSSLSSSVDWITATTQSDAIGMDWLSMYHDVVRSGKYFESERFLKGFTGFGVDGLQWMYNPKSRFYMFIASSDMAARMWRPIAQTAKNITRIDFAVTVTLMESDQSYIQDLYWAMDGRYKAARGYALIQNTAGGTTMYVGKRASQTFGRLYDKGAESDSHKPGNRFRYEVEIKKPIAQPVALGVAQATLSGRDQGHIIGDYVHNWFSYRGVYCPWEYEGSEVNYEVDVSITTPQRRLTWLKTQVSPTVSELIKAGMGRDVMEALNLSDFVQLDLFD